MGLIDYFHKVLVESVVAFRARVMERLQITAFVRRLLVDMQKQLFE